MANSMIAAQLYTLRDFLKTPADIATTLKKVKKIGYDAVQNSALGPIDPKELANILRGEGLTCCSSHVSLERWKNEFQRVIDEHHLWACSYAAVPYFEGKARSNWESLAVEINAIAARLSGLSIGYHNHSHELARYDGVTALGLLIEKLTSSVYFEIDTYWITHGGGDPAQWIGKVAGRMPCVHLKDMAITADRTQLMAEVGEGNLNWPGILAACRAAGVRWYIVEQDVCQRDPFESLAISLRNLRGMGLR
jgi:sugar phosphate isomerase/epimerase